MHRVTDQTDIGGRSRRCGENLRENRVATDNRPANKKLNSATGISTIAATGAQTLSQQQVAASPRHDAGFCISAGPIDTDRATTSCPPSCTIAGAARGCGPPCASEGVASAKTKTANAAASASMRTGSRGKARSTLIGRKTSIQSADCNAILAYLFVPERLYRIEPRRPACREITENNSNGG